jgi:hypothetical protein
MNSSQGTKKMLIKLLRLLPFILLVGVESVSAFTFTLPNDYPNNNIRDSQKLNEYKTKEGIYSNSSGSSNSKSSSGIVQISYLAGDVSSEVSSLDTKLFGISYNGIGVGMGSVYYKKTAQNTNVAIDAKSPFISYTFGTNYMMTIGYAQITQVSSTEAGFSSQILKADPSDFSGNAFIGNIGKRFGFIDLIAGIYSVNFKTGEFVGSNYSLGAVSIKSNIYTFGLGVNF